MTETLLLRRTTGPEHALVPEELSIESTVILGRAVDTDVCLPESSVSRKHATLLSRDDGWYIMDLDSTTGTRVNRSPISAERPVKLEPGDQIGIGPWVFQVQGDPTRNNTVMAIGDPAPVAGGPATSNRLDALSQCMTALEDATNVIELAQAAARAAMAGTGFRRAAVLLPPEAAGDDPALLSGLERLASGAERELSAQDFRPSSTLITTACEGTVASHTSDAPMTSVNLGQSIADLSIHTAVCAPVFLDNAVRALLYLDARGEESRIRDAAAFCEDVARLYGFALSREAQAELRQREHALQIELDYARELRSMLAPPPQSRVGFYDVAYRTMPGLFVSADLFDVMTQEDGSRIVLFGDASGHGVGAAMLAALTHAHLSAAFQSDLPLAEAVQLTNRFLTDRDTGGRFISLLVARFSPDGTMRMIDAGHGHWMRIQRNGTAIHAGRSTSPPLGISPAATFEPAESMLSSGDRILCYTDGIIDQIDPHGEPFGVSRLERAVDALESPDDDVTALFRALERHSSGRLDDDCTVASIQFRADD